MRRSYLGFQRFWFLQTSWLFLRSFLRSQRYCESVWGRMSHPCWLVYAICFRASDQTSDQVWLVLKPLLLPWKFASYITVSIWVMIRQKNKYNVELTILASSRRAAEATPSPTWTGRQSLYLTMKYILFILWVSRITSYLIARTFGEAAGDYAWSPPVTTRVRASLPRSE